MLRYCGLEFIKLVLEKCNPAKLAATAPQSFITETFDTPKYLPKRYLGRYSPSLIFVAHVVRTLLL